MACDSPICSRTDQRPTFRTGFPAAVPGTTTATQSRRSVGGALVPVAVSALATPCFPRRERLGETLRTQTIIGSYGAPVSGLPLTRRARARPRIMRGVATPRTQTLGGPAFTQSL